MGRAAELIRLGVEQKLKRRCSSEHIRLERIVTASPSPEGTPIVGLNWFDDRVWPTVPMNPRPRRRSGRVALGPGGAALLMHFLKGEQSAKRGRDVDKRGPVIGPLPTVSQMLRPYALPPEGQLSPVQMRRAVPLGEVEWL